MLRIAPLKWLIAVLGLMATPIRSLASDYELLSASAQVRIGERTVLGRQSPDSFREYDLRLSWNTPWERQVLSGLSVGARLLASGGLFEGAGKTAAVASAIPVVALGTQDRRFTVDGGAGLGFLSAHRYAQQDFGGHLQFALTVGIEVPLYRRIGLAYRFMHYSDAGVHGPHTVGADLHMAGLTYRFR